MQPQEANAVADDSDLITSHLETAINLTSDGHSQDIELSFEILEFLKSEGEVSRLKCVSSRY